MSPRVDPRLRVLYLGGVAIGPFLVKDARIALGFLSIHALAWLVLGLGARRLLRQVLKLWGFAAFIGASYALTSEDPSVDRWVDVDLRFAHVPLNVGGA